jgi:hypothetical protein
MATIQPFFAPGTRTGSTTAIEMKLMFRVNVGSGTFTLFDDFNVSFLGQIDTTLYKGPMKLILSLTDKNSGALQGPATLSVYGADDPNASYQVSGNQLVIHARLKGKSMRFSIHPGDGGTYLGMSGPLDKAVLLKQR